MVDQHINEKAPPPIMTWEAAPVQQIEISRLVISKSMVSEHRARRIKPELRESVEIHGPIYPLLVRPSPMTEGAYEVLEGKKRLTICKQIMAAEKAIPCRVIAATDAQCLAIAEMDRLATIESAVELGHKINEAIQSGVVESQGLVAHWLRKDKSTVSRLMKASRLPLTILDMFEDPNSLSLNESVRIYHLWRKLPGDKKSAAEAEWPGFAELFSEKNADVATRVRAIRRQLSSLQASEDTQSPQPTNIREIGKTHEPPKRAKQTAPVVIAPSTASRGAPAESKPLATDESFMRALEAFGIREQGRVKASQDSNVIAVSPCGKYGIIDLTTQSGA